jgi:hypothetical protein
VSELAMYEKLDQHQKRHTSASLLLLLLQLPLPLPLLCFYLLYGPDTW